MTVKTRSVAERTGAGLEPLGAANLAGEQIFADQLLQWTLEGRCFTASIEYEVDSDAGSTDHDDLVHDYVLQSDIPGTKLIVPISTEICLKTTGGDGRINVSVEFNRPTNDTATLKAITVGTAMRVHNNRGDGYGTHTAIAAYNCTCTALTATEMVEIAKFTCSRDAIASTAVSIYDLSYTINHFRNAPIILQKGAALSTHAWGGTAPVYRVSFQWAELDAATYLP